MILPFSRWAPVSVTGKTRWVIRVAQIFRRHYDVTMCYNLLNQVIPPSFHE
eukprot:UN03898